MGAVGILEQLDRLVSRYLVGNEVVVEELLCCDVIGTSAVSCWVDPPFAGCTCVSCGFCMVYGAVEAAW